MILRQICVQNTISLILSCSISYTHAQYDHISLLLRKIRQGMCNAQPSRLTATPRTKDVAMSACMTARKAELPAHGKSRA